MERVRRFEVVTSIQDYAKTFTGDISRLVVVEGSKEYPEEGLVFQTVKQIEFVNTYRDYLSRYCMLSELYMLGFFVDQLEADGYTVIFLENTLSVLRKYEAYSQPLEVEGLTFPNGGGLYPFQEFGLQKALAKSKGSNSIERLFFFGWGTGTGKSVVSAAGAQELFNRGEIDLVVAFTLRKLKINLCRNFNSMTQLRAKVVDGPKQKRVREYEEADFDVLVTNYDKCHFDFEDMRKLVSGKRVLWVMDEVQKVLKGERGPTKARTGLDKLVRASRATVWPMSASVVSQTPLRYRDVFALHGRTRSNILGTKAQFERDYLKDKYEKTFYTKKGGRFTSVFFTWDKEKLQSLRHRVAPYVHSVRKTDPGIKETFRGMQTIVHPIQMSEQDQKLYNIVVDKAREAAEAGFSVSDHSRVLRYICNTPEALAHSESELAKELVRDYPDLITSRNSSKVEVFLDHVESIASAGDKVVAFTQFTNLTLFLLSRQLKERDIKHVVHYGAGMSDREAQEAQDKFKSDESITLFLSSDAGAYGLNFQEARYVINYEPTYSYDTLMQRGDRINRADSYLDGLTSYVYCTDNSVEEHIWEINNLRRELASVTLGTKELLGTELSRTLAEGSDDSQQMKFYTIFGEQSLNSNKLV